MKHYDIFSNRQVAEIMCVEIKLIMAAHYELSPVQHHYGPTLGQQCQKDNDCVDFLNKTAQKIW